MTPIPWRSGQRSVVAARVTMDTVKDVRSIGSGGGSPVAVREGDNTTPMFLPSPRLVPLVDTRQHGVALPTSYDAPMAGPSGLGQAPAAGSSRLAARDGVHRREMMSL